MGELQVIKLIRANPYGWEALLAQEPYCITVKRGEGEFEGLVLFKYSQFDSDFTNPVVKECRGLILDSYANWQVVSYGFNKFLNAGEPGADEIDWGTAKVQAKLDGSNCRFSYWHRGERWLCSTLAIIDADSLPCKAFGEDFTETLPEELSTYGKLARSLLTPVVGEHFEKLSKWHTYIFELVSLYNKVVIEYKEPKIYHIGTRDNITLEEIPYDIGIEKPREYPLHSLDAVLEAAHQLNQGQSKPTDEGFVVVDANWHRLKVKSPLYLLAFHATTESFSFERVLNIYLAGEKDEILAYFPKAKKAFDALEEFIDVVCNHMEQGWWITNIATRGFDDKGFANYVNDRHTPWASFYFMKRKCPKLTAHQFLFGGTRPATEADGWHRTTPLVGLRKLLKQFWAIRDKKDEWRY